MINKYSALFVALFLFFCTGCSEPVADGATYTKLQPASTSEAIQSSAQRVAEISGLEGPEAVRYDADLDSYFVANFVGGSRDKDGNGYISKVDAETGEIEHAFLKGQEFPLHAPRGMYITGDTLWVADLEGLHGFNKRSGEQLVFVDLTSHEPSFINDVASSGDGSVYLTDTGGRRVYKVHGQDHEVALEGFGNPNGITFDPRSDAFLIAPWDAGDPVIAWRPGTDGLPPAIVPTGSKIDGIETVGDRIIYAMQSDSTIQVSTTIRTQTLIKTEGKPADIGIDTKRNQIAVPYIALNRVDIWQLPN